MLFIQKKLYKSLTQNISCLNQINFLICIIIYVRKNINTCYTLTNHSLKTNFEYYIFFEIMLNKKNKYVHLCEIPSKNKVLPF